MPDHQTPSMPPLPEPFGYHSGFANMKSPLAECHIRLTKTPRVDEGCTFALYGLDETHAYAQAVADERVRAALAGVLDALEAGHDALAAAATDYHTTMAGYRPHVHKAMDAEVASVKAVLERVRASLAELKGKP